MNKIKASGSNLVHAVSTSQLSFWNTKKRSDGGVLTFTHLTCIPKTLCNQFVSSGIRQSRFLSLGPDGPSKKVNMVETPPRDNTYVEEDNNFEDFWLHQA